MAKQSRRAFLRTAAVAPVAAPAAVHGIAQQAQLGMAGVSALGVGVYRGESGQDAVSSRSGMRLTSFAEWLKAGGDKECRQAAQEVRHIDPDILSMKLPLCTKFQWQRKRNYERALEGQRNWFERVLEEQGFVNWYR